MIFELIWLSLIQSDSYSLSEKIIDDAIDDSCDVVYSQKTTGSLSEVRWWNFFAYIYCINIEWITATVLWQLFKWILFGRIM